MVLAVVPVSGVYDLAQLGQGSCISPLHLHYEFFSHLICTRRSGLGSGPSSVVWYFVAGTVYANRLLIVEAGPQSNTACPHLGFSTSNIGKPVGIFPALECKPDDSRLIGNGGSHNDGPQIGSGCPASTADSSTAPLKPSSSLFPASILPENVLLWIDRSSCDGRCT